jgi:hypothetical protein
MTASYLPSFERDVNDTLAAIDHCVQSRQHMPAKILIYSLIDSLAWAAFTPAVNANRQRFEAWTTRWLIPHLLAAGVNVTATDLYAARCSILHSMTPDSELSRSGKARRIAYAWGTGRAENLNEIFRDHGIAGCVALHYDDLVQAVRKGISSFRAEVNRDPVLQVVFREAAEKHYAYINVPVQGPNDD